MASLFDIGEEEGSFCLIRFEASGERQTEAHSTLIPCELYRKWETELKMSQMMITERGLDSLSFLWLKNIDLIWLELEAYLTLSFLLIRMLIYCALSILISLLP